MKYTLKNKEIELTNEEVKEIVKQSSNPTEEKKIGLEIKNRFTGEIIFTSTKTTYKEAVEEAVGRDISLENANLKNTNLKNTNLYNTNLENANLENTNLENTNLKNTNLYNTNLKNTNLENAKFYGRGGTIKLTKKQVPVFLRALGFIIED